MSRYIETADDQAAFATWMTLVDRGLARLTGGLSSSDLSDQSWRDWFDDGVRPQDAIRECLDNEGF